MQFSLLKNKIFITSFLVILIVVSIIFYFLQTQNSRKTTDTVQPTPVSQTDGEDINPKPIPQPQFANWEESKQLIFAKALPKENSNRYVFKTNYRPEEISRIASFLQTNESYDKAGSLHFYSQTTKNPSFLVFNSQNGNIRYASVNGIPLATDSNKDTTETSIYSFIKKVGIYDDSLRITSTYKNKNQPDITYYEIHRDWEVMGYPILNPIGILNLNEDTLLHELTYYAKSQQTIPDNSIINASDNKDQQARESDFNTVTIGINDKTNSVVTMNSNMRPLLLNSAYSSSQLIDRSEALNELQKNNYNFFISTPSGTGDVSMSKVYPNNEAVAKNAIITEEILVYLEKPPIMNQETLEPYYLFRGYTDLESGYRIEFYAAVSAIKGLADKSISFRTPYPSVAGATTGYPEDPAQKQGTLEFPTGKPTVPPTATPFTSITTTPAAGSPEPSITEQISITPFPTIATKKCRSGTSLSGYYAAQQFEGYTFVRLRKDWPIWYLLFDDTDSYKKIVADMDSFLATVQKFLQTYVTETKDISATVNWVKNEINSFTDSGVFESGICEMAITSNSPSLFLYSASHATYTISTSNEIQYSDPGQVHNTWNVKTMGNSLLVNGVSRNFIYYEYKPVSFTHPSEGWIIKRNNINGFIEKISKSLQLLPAEKDRLEKEFDIALRSTQGTSFFIGILPEEEINAQIPMTISPPIQHVRRLHFYIKPVIDIYQVEAPTLSPIHRSDEMVFEIGAIIAE